MSASRHWGEKGERLVNWCNCPTCWGQGRLIVSRAAHLGHVCPTCLGVGEILREDAPPRAA